MSPFEKRRANFAPRANGSKTPQWHFLGLLFFLVVVNSVWAVDPSRHISQYGHTAWRIQDGAITSTGIITQTVDGYIWMGTRSGLLRFDGVRFVPWLPPKGSSLSSARFSSLLGARDGSLWIGTAEGLSRLQNGRLQAYTNPAQPVGIGTIMEDPAGTIWVTRWRVPRGEGPLCRVEGDQLHCYGREDGIPVSYGLGLTEDSLGNLWFGSSVLCRWRPGSSSSTYFHDLLKHRNAGEGVIDVAAGPSGSVWATIDGVGPNLGVRHYSGGKWTSYVVPGFNGAMVRSHALLIDRNKSLWIGTENDGLYRVHDGVADHYGSADGLSGSSVGFFYEDREGNLWVSTDGGTDVFRDTPVVSFSMHEGLSGSSIRSVLALHNGSVWLANEGAVDILHAGRNSPISAGQGLPGQDAGAMFEDHAGRVWLGLDNKLVSYEHGRFHEVKRSDGSTLAAAGEVTALTEDLNHNIWALISRGSHLFRIANQAVQEDILLSNVVDQPAFLAADRAAGIWIGSKSGVLAHYRDRHFQTTSLREGGSTLHLRGILIDLDNSLLISTGRGLFRLKDDRQQILDARSGLPCDSIFSAIKDDHGSLWLYAQCGLLQIQASELAKWQERPVSQVSVRVFDVLDGAHPNMQSPLQPTSSQAPDGQLWFFNGTMAQMIDPNRSYSNRIPPPGHIEELVADRQPYEPQPHVRLPALTRDLEIDYTALSFVVPQKVRFRYKLEGRDVDWQDAGTRRQAFYNDLRPGQYSFKVIACNNDDVWNDAGATLVFGVAPAWYQTNWFRVLCFVSGVFIVWVIHRLRVLQISRAIGARFDERLAERTRMARDLHDTFLQTIQGSKLVADDALEPSSDLVRMRRALEQVSVWLARATQEGRAALNSLRTATTQTNDLAEALRRATEDGLIPGSMAVTFSVIGDAKEMHPIVRDEIYRIGYEAIRNACTHSGASQLEVELIYAHDLALRVSDNGTGIDPAVADRGKDGHFGLQGMRERAARIGGKLTLGSSSNSGTEITLIVHGSIIFRKKMPARRSLFARIRTLFRRKEQASNLD